MAKAHSACITQDDIFLFLFFIELLEGEVLIQCKEATRLGKHLLDSEDPWLGRKWDYWWTISSLGKTSGAFPPKARIIPLDQMPFLSPILVSTQQLISILAGMCVDRLLLPQRTNDGSPGEHLVRLLLSLSHRNRVKSITKIGFHNKETLTAAKFDFSQIRYTEVEWKLDMGHSENRTRDLSHPMPFGVQVMFYRDVGNNLYHKDDEQGANERSVKSYKSYYPMPGENWKCLLLFLPGTEVKKSKRGIPRIELGTSRTLSENHTTRPNALFE
uniref:Uncharacterized protein n=1 Tax=Cucumis melo TaxID=3656 RepID=A0A9I9E4E3_CUCME